jgi:hypothetical protein
VLLVISRDPAGKEPDDFFFTTDLSLKPAAVIEGFAGRWSIEDTFKNTKQVVGGQEPQTYKGPGPERAAMLMEGAGLPRCDADAAALREFGFETWEALAFAQREWADVERDRLPAGSLETGKPWSLSDRDCK